MLDKYDNVIEEVAAQLRDEALPVGKVQALFDEWWPWRTAAEPVISGDQVMLNVETVAFSISGPVGVQGIYSGELCFPRRKLSEEQQTRLTSTAEVQKLFDEWWPKHTGKLRIADNQVVLEVELKYQPGCYAPEKRETRERFFPCQKLSKAQLEKLAMSYVMWGAGRAAAIALVPLPLADVGPLMANEAYMIHRIAEVYGYTADKSVVAMLAGVAGGSLAGKFFASFLPFLKVAIAPSVTYAVGKAAMAYFASGMTLAEDALKQTADAAGQEARKMDWDELKVENPEEPEIPESPE